MKYIDYCNKFTRVKLHKLPHCAVTYTITHSFYPATKWFFKEPCSKLRILNYTSSSGTPSPYAPDNAVVNVINQFTIVIHDILLLFSIAYIAIMQTK